VEAQQGSESAQLGREGEERSKQVTVHTHFEKIVKVALVRDLAKVDAEEEGEQRLGETRKKAHDAVFLLHRLGKDNNTAGFNYCFGVLQSMALEGRGKKSAFGANKEQKQEHKQSNKNTNNYKTSVSVPGPASA
jgi:hypothetical protein